MGRAAARAMEALGVGEHGFEGCHCLFDLFKSASTANVDAATDTRVILRRRPI